jgi:hypothetical protein
MQVNVVDPNGATQTVILQQTAPGKYEGTFTPTTEGAYLVRVAGTEPGASPEGQAAVAETAGWVLSYSPEYRTLSADPNFLVRLAQSTGGVIASDNLADSFKHNLPAPRAATQPLWPLLLTLAACLLPLDVAVRRLVVTRYDLQRGLERMRAWAALQAPQPATVAPERAEQLSALRRAKDRAGAPAAQADQNLPPPIVSNPVPPKEGPPIPGKPSASPAPGATSSALLAKKREREKKQ